MEKHIKVGLAVLVWRDDKIIFFKRRGSHGHGTWSVPGGHLEFGESWEECASREIMEEVGSKIKNIRLLAATNDFFPKEDKHYITIWMKADWKSGEPRSMEPEKVTNVEWRGLHDLPSPLFEPCWSNLRKIKPDLFG